MSSIVKVRQKNGTVYVYQSDSYWDSEKQQARSKRRLIGKLDPETGEIVPTRKLGRPAKEPITAEETEAGSAEKYRQLYEKACREISEGEHVIFQQRRQLERVIREQKKLLDTVTEALTASIERNEALLEKMKEGQKAPDEQ